MLTALFTSILSEVTYGTLSIRLVTAILMAMRFRLLCTPMRSGRRVQARYRARSIVRQIIRLPVSNVTGICFLRNLKIFRIIWSRLSRGRFLLSRIAPDGILCYHFCMIPNEIEQEKEPEIIGNPDVNFFATTNFRNKN